MGIAGAMLLIVMLFSSSLAIYEEEVNVGKLNRRLEIAKIERKDIGKKLQESRKSSTEISDKLLVLREQLRMEVSEKKRIQRELEGSGEAFAEPSLESDEEKTKIIEGIEKNGCT